VSTEKMALANHFPATTWVWRRLTSRPARLTILLVGSALLLTTFALRIRAAIFEYRVTSIVEGLAKLKLDESNKSELLKLVPTLRPCLPGDPPRPGDSCYAVELSEIPHFRLMESRAHLFEIAYWLGARYWDLSASVMLRQDKVHKLGYHLRLTNGSLSYPGILSIAATSVRGYRAEHLDPTLDESPDYRVTRYFKWPAQTIQVMFTPTAPRNLAHHAFDIRLNCIWYLRGCRTADEVLPLAGEDYQDIKRSAFARVRGPNPCPDRILARRARDVANILLVEVESVHPGSEKSGEEQYQTTDYKLLEILKGKLDWPLKNVRHPFTISLSWDDPPFPNPVLNLLHPGSQFLMFSDSISNVDSPCETVAATESAKRAIRIALQSHALQVPEGDLARW
jgi:hypothetical protein